MIKRNLFFRYLFFRIGEILARIAYQNAKMIILISPGYICIIKEKYRVNPEKIKVVRVGVDIENFKPTRNEPYKKGKFRVLYSGAFSVAYDFDQVLKAAKIIEEIDDRVEFIIQGGGELIDHINSLVRELKPRNVKIINKIFSREDIANFLNTADILILPLRITDRPYQGMSTKLYEYQAVGKPILCCAEGQPAKYVMETESGIIVRPGDYEGLAKSVLYLKENHIIAEKMGASGRRYVENNLSIEKMGKRVLGFI